MRATQREPQPNSYTDLGNTMKYFVHCASIAAGLLAASCSGLNSATTQSSLSNSAAPAVAVDDDDGEEEGTEIDIALCDLPQAVRATALAAVPGIVLSEAEQETEDGKLIYSIEGTANGQEYSIEVAADGTLIEVENEGQDDGEDEN